MSETLKMDDFMMDARGRLVPKTMIPEIDRERHDLVNEIVDAAKNLQKAMVEFKARAMGDVQAFVDLSAEKYDVVLGGRKGNTSLVSFDGRLKVQIAINEHLTFDERLKAAKALIDECITAWAEGSRDEIKTIVMDAFQVDKEGKLNTGRIIGLRRLAIDDSNWLKAMEAISDSMQVVGSKTYLRVYERASADDRWVPVALDLAAL
ncbi:sulfate transporter [Desulfosarcina widdelii]|uniref:Sulfate transporter n=1 Tax=Desulfosarcina widdelii TaxID=947919 RepID=A0A5K7Z9R9_9BACT|nr:DUF3164 family protein [Desulfosarcina widdelii]BBO78596.1 sulfate transporter [Desulfosarcina widdelii]